MAAFNKFAFDLLFHHVVLLVVPLFSTGIFAFWNGAGKDGRFEHDDTTRIIYIYS